MGPAAICTLNVLGSLAIGGLAGAGTGPRVSLALGTGFCGAFTTFSTFAIDSVNLITAERYVAAAAYVLANNCLSIGGAAAVGDDDDEDDEEEEQGVAAAQGELTRPELAVLEAAKARAVQRELEAAEAARARVVTPRRPPPSSSGSSSFEQDWSDDE